MQTRTRGEGSFRTQASHGVTDWHALEVQLNRTRLILQDILLHLQEVLRNLQSVRNSANAFAGASRGATGNHSRDARSATGSGTRFRSQNTHQNQTGRERFQGASAFGSQPGASERFRTKTRSSGFEARTGASGQTRSTTGSQSRWTAGNQTRFTSGSQQTRTNAGNTRFASGGQTTFTGSQTRTESAGDKAGAGKTWSFRAGNASSSRTTGQTGGTGREHTRTENAWRAKTAGQGAERDNRTRQTTSTQRPFTRSTTRGRGFHMDSDRQYRARQMARKCGMNLKCAYDILCLDYPCSSDEIKAAYRQMARIHHPDLGGDEETMKDVNVAYELAMRFCSGPRQASTAWAV